MPLFDSSSGSGAGGSGTSGTIPKWTAGTTLGDSILTESGSVLTLTGTAVFTGGSLTLNDTVLQRDAAGKLSLRNLANAQTFEVYGTTDAGLNNYRRLRSTMATGGAATIAAEGLGTGVSGNALDLVVNGITGLTITSAGSLSTGGSITSTGGGVTISTSSSFRVNSKFTLYGGSDGQYIFGNYGLTDADIFLKFGVNTSAAAGIKRVGTVLQGRLNDDSGFATIQGKLRTDTAYAAGVVTDTGTITITDSTGTAYRVLCAV